MAEMQKYWFVYEETDERGKTTNVIRIRAKRKPGPNTRPRSGTWVVQEWIQLPTGDWDWRGPCFPEITWGRLSKMRLARKVKYDHQ